MSSSEKKVVSLSDQGLRTMTHYLKKPVPKTTQRCSTCKPKTSRQRNCSSPTFARPRLKILHRFLVHGTENFKSIKKSSSPPHLIKTQNNKNQHSVTDGANVQFSVTDTAREPLSAPPLLSLLHQSLSVRQTPVDFLLVIAILLLSWVIFLSRLHIDGPIIVSISFLLPF